MVPTVAIASPKSYCRGIDRGTSDASLARDPKSGGGEARPAGLGAQPDLRIVRIASADAELRKTLIDECLAGCLIVLDGAGDWMAVNGQGNARRISLRCLPRVVRSPVGAHAWVRCCLPPLRIERTPRRCNDHRPGPEESISDAVRCADRRRKQPAR